MEEGQDKKITSRWHHGKLSITTQSHVSIADTYSESRKVTLYVMGVLEAFLVGLTVFGWSSLVFVYRQAGIYDYLCPQNGNLTANR
jgi:hypothetical protein